MQSKLRVLLIVVGWFAGLLIIDCAFAFLVNLSSIYRLLELPIGVAWGSVVIALIWGRWQNVHALVRPVVLLTSLVLAVMGPFVTIGSVFEFTYDPIGVGNDAGTDCKSNDLADVLNRKGHLVATVRKVECGLWDRPSTYFVFVHNAQDKPTRQDLVFRYRGGWEGDRWGEPPEVSWREDGSLQIHVYGKIEQITEQRSNENGADISYSLPAPECATALNQWQRLLWLWIGRLSLC